MPIFLKIAQGARSHPIPRPIRVMLSLLAILSLLGLLDPASADIKNRNLLPLGERESFMGNAGAALGGSPTNAYYNPGGLAVIPQNNISLSGSTFLYNDYNADKFTNLDNTDLPFRAFGSATIPASLVSVMKAGSVVLAGSILVPGTFVTSNRVRWTTTNTITNIAQMQESSEIWVGGSVAGSVSESCNLGSTLFGTKVSLNSLTQIRVKFPALPNYLIAQTQFSKTTIYNAILAAGLYCTPSPNWSLGLKIMSPSIKLYGKSDVFSATDVVAPPTAMQTSETEMNQVDANYVYPMDATLGIQIYPSSSFRMLADISIQAATSFETLPGQSAPGKTETASTLRYNLGTQYLFGNNSSWVFGVNFNPSATQVVNLEGEQMEDFYGVSTGYLSSGTRVRWGIGGFYIWSSGQRVVRTTGEKAPIRSQIGGLLLTTSYIY